MATTPAAWRGLLPAGAVAATGGDEDEVPRAERVLVAGRPETRRQEFVAGRACARVALAALGRPLGSGEVLDVRPDRGPGWPVDVVGSIAHGAGEVVAAVARRRSPADRGGLAGLGVDVEPVRDLDAATAALVADESELAAATACGLDDAGPVVVFSTKEAVYKAVAPTVGWLEHDDVRVLLDPSGGFVATLSRGGGSVTGRWAVEDGVVRTAAWIDEVRE